MPSQRMVEYVLPKSCPQGYTKSDLEFIFHPKQLEDFYDWMFGQTQGVCDGMSGEWHYPEDADYEDVNGDGTAWFQIYRSPCWGSAHGVVAYRYDVERYIEGGFRKMIWD